MTDTYQMTEDESRIHDWMLIMAMGLAERGNRNPFSRSIDKATTLTRAAENIALGLHRSAPSD